MGSLRYRSANELLITADGGGSNSSRSRLWKLCLQDLADDVGLSLGVCHFPPGTSKWNKIERRMFSQISLNWCGRPLNSHDVVVNLIASTSTREEVGLFRVSSGSPWNSLPLGGALSQWNLCGTNSLATSVARARLQVIYIG